jgi:hypothetical protein
MHKTLTSVLSFPVILLSMLIVFGCNKKKADPSAPLVLTVGVTDVTDSSAKAGGKITSTGQQEITATGFCWSNSNNMPTIEGDDTSKAVLSSGGFVTELFNLQPSATYYIRAYAINSLGVGYGEAISFTTGNAVPVADSVNISGIAAVDSILTASYKFTDFENDPDSGTAVQWYIAADTISSLTEVPIADADTLTYTVNINDTLKFIRVGITPASSLGTTPGRQVKSSWVGPVPKP